MKRFNIAKNPIYLSGYCVPAGAVYGKIDGVVYVMSNTHKRRNGGTMSYITILDNGRITFKNNVNDSITRFISDVLEKYSLRGKGVLYNEIERQKEKDRKAAEAEAEKKRIMQESARRKYLREYKKQSYYADMMQDCTRKHRQKFTVHASYTSPVRLDIAESAICNASMKSLDTMREADRRCCR